MKKIAYKIIIVSIFISNIIACGGGGGDNIQTSTQEILDATTVPINTRFVKIDNNGTPVLDAAQSWSCVLDKINGLTWEVKTDDGGLRDKDWVYTSYETIGTNGNGICDAAKTCNQSYFKDAVNRAGLCGHKDWRLVRLTELESLQDQAKNRAPYINTQYFPFTASNKYWTTTEFFSAANQSVAWVDFSNLQSGSTRFRDIQFHVRLVRP